MDDSDEIDSLCSDVCDDYSIEFDEGAEQPSTSTVNDSKKPTSNSCRLCLILCTNRSKNIETFANLYATCTGFIVQKKDIPKKICDACYDQLENVKKFIEKCSETEDILNNFRNDDYKNNVGSNSDVEADFGDDSSSDKNTPKRGRPKTVRPINRVNYRPPPKRQVVHLNANGEVITPRRGRPPKDPSGKKIKVPSSRPRGRPRLDPDQKKPKLPVQRGRPRETKVERQIISGINEKGEYEIKMEDGTVELRLEKQICYMCGKMVRLKHLPYHLWKHKKDKEGGNGDENQIHKCEFCHTNYKTELQKQYHMKRAHPASAFVKFEEAVEEIDENQEEVDTFEKEFNVPNQEEFQIEVPYSHTQALRYLQPSIKK